MNKKTASRYGPWALVTGASDGIGRAFAVEIARRGGNLVLVARRRKALEELAHTIADEFGVETRILDLDLASRANIQKLAAGTKELDIGLLVASAGFGTSGRFDSTDIDTELSMIQVNCAAVFELTRIFADRFTARGGGGMILMSSIVAFQGTPFAANYAATKAYVQALAEGIAPELASKGVHVLACAPGPVASGFAKKADMVMGAAEKPERVARAALNALGRKRTMHPGLLSKLLTGALDMLPRRARSAIMARVMRGMTKHQDAATG